MNILQIIKYLSMPLFDQSSQISEVLYLPSIFPSIFLFDFAKMFDLR